MRLSVFAALWARSDGGTVVASPEGGALLEDLEWLRIDPEEFLPSNRRDRCQELAAELVASGRAYPCFCTPAELRDMYSLQASVDRPPRYDGRCRRLSKSDIESLKKVGRKGAIRLLVPDVGAALLAGIADAATLDDFRLLMPGDAPSEVFGDLVDDRDAEATHVFWSHARRHLIPQREVLARVLGWELPDVTVLPDWVGADGKPVTSETPGATVAELRAAGFHPRAVLLAAASAGWNPGESTDFSEMASHFRIEDVSADPALFTLDVLRAANADVLGVLPAEELRSAVEDHLTRRGFPISERDTSWQLRFVQEIRPELSTLADTEVMAALLLTPTVDYDRDVARTLREPATQDLITTFEAAMAGVEGDTAADWRAALNRFRAGVSTPGRALATLRLVLTGQRNGPNLASILALLGVDGCRTRLSKARRYASS